MAERKQNRVRIDAIIRAVKEGKYDDKLKELSDAIEARNLERRKVVDKLVEEVYGPGFTVRPDTLSPGWQDGSVSTPPPLGGNPFIQRARNAGELPDTSTMTPEEIDAIDWSQYEVRPGDIPEVRDPNEEEGAGEEEGIISTGAQIGGLPDENIVPEFLPGDRP